MTTTFISYLRSFFSNRDRALQKSTLLIVFSHLIIFAVTSIYTFQAAFNDIKSKASQTTEEIEKIIFDEFDAVLIEGYIFLKEMQKHPLKNEREDSLRKLKFFPLNNLPFSTQSYLDHTFNISHPFVDKETGLWSISLKLLVHDRNNSALGFIVKNLNLREFCEKIRGRLHKEGVIFTLIDDNYKIILQSKNNPYDQNSLFYIEAFEKISQQHPNLEENFSFVKDSQFLNFKKLKNYPCIILTGINYTEFFYGLKKNIFLQFIYIMISLVSCISILFYFSYKKQCSFFSFQSITKNYYFQFSVESILDHIKGFSFISEPDFIERREAHPLSPPIKTESFISDCLLLLEDKIYKYKVKIDTNIEKDQLIKKHLFPLQQIFLGLLSFSLEHNKEKRILIASYSDENFLYLKIEDSTFFLSEALREQLSKQLRENNLFLLNFKSIKEIANSLGIKIFIREKETNGNIILVTIPLNMKDTIKETSHNIINFAKGKTLKP